MGRSSPRVDFLSVFLCPILSNDFYVKEYVRRAVVVLMFAASCGRPSAPASSVVEADGDFEPFVAGDWQKRFHESPQTYEDYVRDCENRKTATRHVFYLQPLGELSASYAKAIAEMRNYAEIFFGVEAKVVEPIALPPETYAKDREQYDSSRLLHHLAVCAPADALVYVGITDRDLYSPGLNFVFGEGSLHDRTGVYSLTRYETKDAALFRRRAINPPQRRETVVLSVRRCS